MPRVWHTSRIVCFVGLHRSHSRYRRILPFLMLNGRCDFTKCINLVQANLGNTLLCYFPFRNIRKLAVSNKLITERDATAKSGQVATEFGSEHFFQHFCICLSTLFHYKISSLKSRVLSFLKFVQYRLESRIIFSTSR